MFILNDSTPEHVTHGTGFARGLDLSLKGSEGYAGVADPFPRELIIPSHEWRARTEEMEETKTRLSDIALQADLPCKSQEHTNYCWANAAVHSLELIRAIQNQPLVILSAASVAAPIKRFLNIGGWGREALRWIAENGIVPESMWPGNAIDRTYFTEEAMAVARSYRTTEWWVLNTIEEYISCLLRRIPVPIGLLWWGHEVTAYEPVWLDGEIAVRFRNSWGMDYGTDGGYGILQGRKMIPDDMVAPRVAVAA